MDKRKLLSDEKLQTAFKLFDKDNGGTISANEVKDVLGIGKNIGLDVWNQVV